jgi:hypothetical protein
MSLALSLALSLSKLNFLLCRCNHLLGLLLLEVAMVCFFSGHGSAIKSGVNADLDDSLVIHYSADPMLGACRCDCIGTHRSNTQSQDANGTAERH